MNLTTVIDREIPLARELFAYLGSVRCLPADKINANTVADADILVIRSVNHLDATLIAGSRLLFVASATIGTDHVDLDLLANRGIGFAAAPGCNAPAVAQYVCSALAAKAQSDQRDFSGQRIGIVGVGHIGSLVAKMAPAFGLQVIAYDPLRQQQESGFQSADIGSIMDCEVITLHVPLTRQGPYATENFADSAFFSQIKQCRLFINSSRGAVVDSAALCQAINHGQIEAAVLDVYAQEPYISSTDVEGLYLATPHIAGYSIEGKMRASLLVFRAVCDYFHLAIDLHLPTLLAGIPWLGDSLSPRTFPGDFPIDNNQDLNLLNIIQYCYDIRADDRLFRQSIMRYSSSDQAHGFQSMRRGYPLRREFSAYTLDDKWDCEMRRKLSNLGFSDSPIGLAANLGFS